jgi:serine/threonine protein kinase
VTDKEGVPLLGSGSYGKVFCAYTSMGWSCAIKVYRSRDAKHEAAYEAATYKKLDKLLPSQALWCSEL